jgi:hypothetical protein
MTRLYINLSYTSPYFQRHRHILIQQRGILWSKHSCWIPYYEWKDLFQTMVPVEIGYDRLKQLQYDNLSHFKDIDSIYNGMAPQASLDEKCVYIGLLLCIFCVITMLYYIQ